MMHRYLLFIFLLASATSSFAQDITRRDADSMLTVLDKSEPDINKIDLLLNIAQFHIFKTGENQRDLDSADTFIKKAAALNITLKSNDASGYLVLTESFLSKEKGQKDEAKKKVEK